MTQTGVLTISLDFELYWGVRDHSSVAAYKDRLLGARTAIPEMLSAFTEFDVHATWATVGLLFLKDIETARARLPSRRPNYHNQTLSPYDYLESDEVLEPVYHFAPELISSIQSTPGQEVGTHTFSHYYCIEPGQTIDDFRADIEAAVQVANDSGIAPASLIFPRNQWNPAYLALLPEFGIRCFRGTEASWVYRAADQFSQSNLQRAVRLADCYLNLTGHHSYRLAECLSAPPYNFPSSRMLRPYSEKLALLEKLRLRRIKQGMTHAAKNGEVYHLWWHPHNFGRHLEKNMEFLRQILAHFASLKRQYGMDSRNMKELCQSAAA